jgi:hypothetical protein
LEIVKNQEALTSNYLSHEPVSRNFAGHVFGVHDMAILVDLQKEGDRGRENMTKKVQSSKDPPEMPAAGSRRLQAVVYLSYIIFIFFGIGEHRAVVFWSLFGSFLCRGLSLSVSHFFPLCFSRAAYGQGHWSCRIDRDNVEKCSRSFLFNLNFMLACRQTCWLFLRQRSKRK